MRDGDFAAALITRCTADIRASSAAASQWRRSDVAVGLASLHPASCVFESVRASAAFAAAYGSAPGPQCLGHLHCHGHRVSKHLHIILHDTMGARRDAHCPLRTRKNTAYPVAGTEALHRTGTSVHSGPLASLLCIYRSLGRETPCRTPVAQPARQPRLGLPTVLPLAPLHDCGGIAQAE